MQIYIPDRLFPQIENRVLGYIEVGRDVFILSALYDELMSDPTAYDESVCVAMDDFLVQNLTNDQYRGIFSERYLLSAYERCYVTVREIAAQYLKKLIQDHDCTFEIRHGLNNKGYWIDLSRT